VARLIVSLAIEGFIDAGRIKGQKALRPNLFSQLLFAPFETKLLKEGYMPTCVKCGSQAAYWAIVDKENYLKEYCDSCFKSMTWQSTKRKWMSTTGERTRKRQESDGRYHCLT
jgi:hypothetical protein